MRVVIGMPRSGKTTLMRNFAIKEKWVSYQYLCEDEFTSPVELVKKKGVVLDPTDPLDRKKLIKKSEKLDFGDLKFWLGSVEDKENPILKAFSDAFDSIIETVKDKDACGIDSLRLLLAEMRKTSLSRNGWPNSIRSFLNVLQSVESRYGASLTVALAWDEVEDVISAIVGSVKEVVLISAGSYLYYDRDVGFRQDDLPFVSKFGPYVNKGIDLDYRVMFYPRYLTGFIRGNPPAPYWSTGATEPIARVDTGDAGYVEIYPSAVALEHVFNAMQKYGAKELSELTKGQDGKGYPKGVPQ